MKNNILNTITYKVIPEFVWRYTEGFLSLVVSQQNIQVSQYNILTMIKCTKVLYHRNNTPYKTIIVNAT